MSGLNPSNFIWSCVGLLWNSERLFDKTSLMDIKKLIEGLSK